jgi:hypothetical protein
VALALKMRSATTVWIGWLADRLSMRSAADVSQILLRANAREALSRLDD